RLQRPEKQRRQPGVLFESARGVIIGANLARPKYLVECGATDRLPNVRKETALVRARRFGIAAEWDLASLSVLNAGVAAVDLHRWSDTSKYQVRSANAFT